MKKQILNLGKTLNKVEQKIVNGGYPLPDCEYPAYRCADTFGGLTKCCFPEN